MTPRQSYNLLLHDLEQALSARFGWQINGVWRDELIAAVKKKSQRTGATESDYCRMAAKSTGEMDALVEMISNGETRFFRDVYQLDALRDNVIQELRQLRLKDRKLDCWSSACSTGEEAYSLAILLSENLPQDEEWKIKIFATDARSSAILSATQGHYNFSEIRALSQERQTAYFTNGERNQYGDVHTVIPAIRKLVSFRRANLYDSKFWTTLNHPFDLILCNNLLVYFHALAVKRTVDLLAASLRSGGFLIVMNNEASYVQHAKLRADTQLTRGFFRKI